VLVLGTVLGVICASGLTARGRHPSREAVAFCVGASVCIVLSVATMIVALVDRP
jgi:hypothetical protein